jgi:hypothetical protein
VRTAANNAITITVFFPRNVIILLRKSSPPLLATPILLLWERKCKQKIRIYGEKQPESLALSGCLFFTFSSGSP